MRRRIVAVVAAPGQGKTSAILALAAEAQAAGLVVGGVAQVAFPSTGPRQGYLLRDLATGEERVMAVRCVDPAPGALAFTFRPDAWDWAATCILRARQQADVLLVDELGRLEAEGGGHLPALVAAVAGERTHTWVLGVRDLALPAVRQAFGTVEVLGLPVSGVF